MRNLDRYLSALSEIGSAINRGNITAGNNAVDAIVIKLVAKINGEPSFALLQRSRTGTPRCRSSTQVQRSRPDALSVVDLRPSYIKLKIENSAMYYFGYRNYRNALLETFAEQRGNIIYPTWVTLDERYYGGAQPLI